MEDITSPFAHLSKRCDKLSPPIYLSLIL